MAFENGGTPDDIQIPSTPKEMIEEYLAFKDSRGTPEEKKVRRDNALAHTPNSEYAAGLKTIAEREGMRNVISTASEIRRWMRDDAKKLNVPLSELAKDRSWVMQDMGRQSYFSQHPE